MRRGCERLLLSSGTWGHIAEVAESVQRSRILVTGGAGFIGSHLIDLFLKEGQKVTLVDDMSGGSLNNLDSLEDPNLRVREGDFADPSVLNAELPESSVVVHLAALTSVPYSIIHSREVIAVNAVKTDLLLRSCVEHAVPRFLLASTAAVYGNQRPPVSEDMPPNPLSPYASSKVSAEASVRSFYKSYGLSSVILRFMNVYGSRSQSSSESVIPIFITALRKKNGLVIYGDGEQTRDFVHVNDVVDSLVKATTTVHSDADVFNVGTGIPTTINGLVSILKELVPERTLDVVHLAERPGDVRHSYASTEKASRYLGFSSSKGLRAGLQELLKEEGIT